MTDQNDTALVSFAWRMRTPYQANESLSVYPDGSAWYWSAQPLDLKSRDRVGTFKLQLPTSELASLSKLAAGLQAEPITMDKAGPFEAEYTVSVTANGQQKYQVLVASQTLPIFKEAAHVGNDLRGRAEAAPLAVLQLSLTPAELQLTQNVPGSFFLHVSNVGAKTTQISLKPGRVAVQAMANGQWETWWQGDVEAVTSGFTGSDGSFLGGVFASADAAPHSSIQAFIGDVLRAPSAGTFQIVCHVEGYMTLLYPPAENKFQSDVQTPFFAESKAVDITVT